MRRFKYLATQPDLPKPEERSSDMRDSPRMDNKEMADWLDRMDDQGWDFVGYGQTAWHERATQEWWIFKKPVNGGEK